MPNLEKFYQRFCNEGFDADGVIRFFQPVYGENFNFAYDVVDELAAIAPDRRCLVWCDTTGNERTFSFSEMKLYSDKCANMLWEQGVRAGDKVLLVLKRHYEFWFTVLALHKIGAIGVPATNLLTTHDLQYRLDAAGITACVVSGACPVAEYVDEACEAYPHLKVKIMARGTREGWLSYDGLLDAASDQWERQPTLATDTMLLYFTSGTSANPKMVCHNFAYPLSHIVTARYWHNAHEDDLHLTVAETGWAKAVWGKIYGQWLVGATIFVYDFDKFVPADLLAMIEKYKVTTFCAPPTIYRFFIKEGLGDFDLSSLRYSTTAGEALNAEVYDKWLAFTGLRLMESYGQTETTVLSGNFVGSTPKPGSMGKPSPQYSIVLLDNDGNPVPKGESGEVCVDLSKGVYGLFSTYYKDQAAMDRVWHDGYYHTGDAAWEDEDGFLWFVGRTDDVIKASGYRISPFEIESVLMEHPAVLECAVTGAPDPQRGTVIKASVILTSSYKPSDALKKELQTYVKTQTAPYKYPRILEFVEELPKTISGKIRRVAIRDKDKAAAQA